VQGGPGSDASTMGHVSGAGEARLVYAGNTLIPNAQGGVHIRVEARCRYSDYLLTPKY